MCRPPPLVPDAAEEARRQAGYDANNYNDENGNEVPFQWEDGENSGDWLSPEEAGWDWTEVCAAGQPDAAGVPPLEPVLPKPKTGVAALQSKQPWKKAGLRPVAPANVVPVVPFVPAGMTYQPQMAAMQGGWPRQINAAQAWAMQQQMGHMGQPPAMTTPKVAMSKMMMGGSKGMARQGGVPYPVAGLPVNVSGYAGVPMWHQPEQVSTGAEQFETFSNGFLPNGSCMPPVLMNGAKVASKARAPVMGMPKLSPAMVGGMMTPQEDDWGLDGADGTDGDEPEDGAVSEKKMKRMLSNRASAKRSRQRRQERLDVLEMQSAKLRVENAQLVRKQNESDNQLKKYAEENARLRAEVEELWALLESHKLTPPSSVSCVQKAAGSSAVDSKSGSSENQSEAHNEAHSGDKRKTPPSPGCLRHVDKVPALCMDGMKRVSDCKDHAEDLHTRKELLAAEQVSSPGAPSPRSGDSSEGSGIVNQDPQARTMLPAGLLTPKNESMEVVTAVNLNLNNDRPQQAIGDMPSVSPVTSDAGMVVDEWFESLCECLDGKELEFQV